jgi:DNA-binding transcriptional MerR regulator/methylmalonyl-CoA mutase cobalamin-binding subunit
MANAHLRATLARPAGLSIADVESETGLSRDVLRTWERRYGFPQPERDARGDRVYPPDQVEKLRLIRRLMARGHRPHAVIGENIEKLQRLDQAVPQLHRNSPPSADEIDRAVSEIRAHKLDALRRRLQRRLAELGVRRFVLECAAPLCVAVGEAWAEGEISVADEHLFSEQMSLVLRAAAAGIPLAPESPRVLLTTVPGEQHMLGILMLEALLALEGAWCIPLGIQTPLSEIARAAQDYGADVVALSFSAAFARQSVSNALTALRRLMPPETVIWAGGEGVAGLRYVPDGVRAPMTLQSARRALDELRLERCLF